MFQPSKDFLSKISDVLEAAEVDYNVSDTCINHTLTFMNDLGSYKYYAMKSEFLFGFDMASKAFNCQWATNLHITVTTI